MRRLTDTTQSMMPRGAAMETLKTAANLPPEVDFSNSFVEPPRSGGVGSAVRYASRMTDRQAQALGVAPDVLMPTPLPVNTPSILPDELVQKRSLSDLSGLPDSLLDTPRQAINKDGTPYRDDNGNTVSYTLAQALDNDELKEQLRKNNIDSWLMPVKAPSPSEVAQQMLAANPGLFQLPTSPITGGIDPAFSPGRTPGFVPNGAGGGGFDEDGNSGATAPSIPGMPNLSGTGVSAPNMGAMPSIPGLIGAGGGVMDIGVGLATGEMPGIGQLAGDFAGLLPPDIAPTVMQAAAVAQGFQDIAKNGLSLGSASGLIDQLGNQLGIPGLGQIATAAQGVLDSTDNLENFGKDPTALLESAIGPLVAQLPPLAQAAIQQAEAIVNALKALTAPPTDGVPAGVPGVYVEKKMIASSLVVPTQHAIPLMPGPGCITVMSPTPVWRVGLDMHFCPLPMPTIPPVPHGLGIVVMGAVRTFAEFGPIARHGDPMVEMMFGPLTVMEGPAAGGGGDDDNDDDNNGDSTGDTANSGDEGDGGSDKGDDSSDSWNGSDSSDDASGGDDVGDSDDTTEDENGFGDPGGDNPEDQDADGEITPVGAKTDPSAGTAFKDGKQKCVAYDDEVRCGGSRAWRNNNPGNLKYGPVAENNGAIGKDSDGFAIFPSQDKGEAALTANLDRPFYQNKTVGETMKSYSPPFENDTDGYVDFIKKRTGIDADTKMSTLNQDQRSNLENAIKTMEGSRPGTIRPRIDPPNPSKPTKV